MKPHITLLAMVPIEIGETIPSRLLEQNKNKNEMKLELNEESNLKYPNIGREPKILGFVFDPQKENPDHSFRTFDQCKLILCVGHKCCASPDEQDRTNTTS